MPIMMKSRSRRMTRRWLRRRLLNILGDCRLLWLPRAGDTTVNQTDETGAGRVLTYDATVAARLSSLGRGMAQAFDGSTNYGTTPDTANLSFGTGTADQPVSFVVLANVTDTASPRNLLSKYGGLGSGEWIFQISAADKLFLGLYDDSANVNTPRFSDAAISQGAWHLYGATYDGTGGATAANGITLYQDGAVIASTATNNASYVAMEHLAAPLEIGSIIAHTANFFSGSLALAAVCARALTAADHAALTVLMRQFFSQGLP